MRQIISEKTYNFGDKWHVSTADTTERRINATLRFTEEETKMEADARGQIHTRKERVQRLLEMDVQMKEEPNDTTVIQFDFHPKVEGMAFYACDSIVSGIMNDVEATLGAGTDAGNPLILLCRRRPGGSWESLHLGCLYSGATLWLRCSSHE